MNKLFKDQNVTTYKLQKDLGLTHDRLYKYTKCTRKIENIPTDLLLKISHYFKIEVNKMYKDMLDYQKEKIIKK